MKQNGDVSNFIVIAVCPLNATKCIFNSLKITKVILYLIIQHIIHATIDKQSYNVDSNVIT